MLNKGLYIPYKIVELRLLFLIALWSFPGYFRCAQEDYLKIFMISTTSFALSCRSCPARIAPREYAALFGRVAALQCAVLFAALKRTT